MAEMAAPGDVPLLQRLRALPMAAERRLWTRRTRTLRPVRSLHGETLVTAVMCDCGRLLEDGDHRWCVGFELSQTVVRVPDDVLKVLSVQVTSDEHPFGGQA